MRAWVLGATLCAALLVSPLWAQRGGGGGGHGGFGGGGHAGAGFAGRVGGPSGGHSVISLREWNAGWGNNWGWRGNGWYWRGNRYGWRYPYGSSGYGWAGGWGWYPWWGWDDDSYDDDGGYSYPTSGDYAQAYPPYGYPPYGYPPYGYQPSQYMPPSGSAASYASEGEVQRIQQEVAQLRAQQEQRYTLQPSSTTLIYRDGHSEAVTNFAIAGNTLWVFDQNHARKVPLSDLDIPATKRDNEEHGSEFVVPNAH
ncbi:MAG TPA: hypothetical protein VMD98_02765 [Bryocella sp.]|nr:hypothetical protein [Bryocella sp.]